MAESNNQNPPDALLAAAEQVRQQLGLTAFDADAVMRLSEFVEANRVALPAAQRDGLVASLGCFLGQCLVVVYGGEWAKNADGETGVELEKRVFLNPFYLVNRQLNEGESASVAAFFASVPRRLVAPPPGRSAWIS